MPMPRPTFTLEDRHSGIVCGVDEVGRGPLAGPVIAAAIIIDRARAPTSILAQINDSKKLTPQKREYLFSKIQEFSETSLGVCGVDEIDRLNILQATMLAMQRAMAGLKTTPALALIDGNRAPKLACPTLAVIKGDSISLSIAAASIIAKHTRDALMKNLAKDFPQYSWERNAGYGTPAHLKAIEIHGVTIHHRCSFAPVANRLLQESSANI